MNKYEALRNEYPEYVSLDDLYKICKIAKRSARYLVENGIIPAIDTGKKTWRYKISIEDVISYLQKRDSVGSMIPIGVVTSRKKGGIDKSADARPSFSQIIDLGYEREVAKYFKHIYAEYGEVLTANDITEMTGLNKSTILKLLGGGHIKSLCNYPKYLVLKQYLLEFVASKKFIEASSKSENFKKIIGGFWLWKNAKS